jgi:multidrug efflux system membrane fusion protein
MRSSFRIGSSRSCLTFGVLAVLAAGCGGGAETGPPPPPDVGVAKPIQRDVTVFSEHLGSTQAYEAVEVQARVTGELEQITFEPSTMVEEGGQQLFVIEPRQYKAERDAADAALKSAEAELARAESDLKRVEQAVKTNAVSESDVDLARAQRDMARAPKRRSIEPICSSPIPRCAHPSPAKWVAIGSTGGTSSAAVKGLC